MTVPLAGRPLGAQRDLVARLVDRGYTDAWSAETAGVDGFAPLLLAADWQPELRVGTAIVSAFTRGPGILAQHALALAQVAPGRCVLGLGSSSDVIVERWNGILFDHPYQRVRDTVAYLRQALGGQKVSGPWETIIAGGFRLEEAPDPAPPIYVAGLRRGMLRLAGRDGDGAILNWLAPHDVPTLVAEVHHGCREAGKSTEVDVVARIFVVPTEDADQARSIGRFLLASYMNVPVYRAFHEWLGRGEAFAGMWQAWTGGDRQGALAAIGDDVVDDLVVWGSPAAVRDRVAEYVRRGVTVPVVMPIPGVVSPEEAIDWCAPN